MLSVVNKSFISVEDFFMLNLSFLAERVAPVHTSTAVFISHLRG